MSLVEHARRELELCGQYAEDPEYSESLIRAVEAFTSFGHSGGSAAIAQEQLAALLANRPLSPLTSDPADWIDQSAASGRPMWQNRRDLKAFSEDGGKTWYWLDEETVPPSMDREIKLREARDTAQAELRQTESEHNDFVNEILLTPGDEWDGDAAAEAIAIEYVRALEGALHETLSALDYISQFYRRSFGIFEVLGGFADRHAYNARVLIRDYPANYEDRIEHLHGDGSECIPGCPAYDVARAFHEVTHFSTGDFDDMKEPSRKLYLRAIQQLLDKGVIIR